MVLNGSVLDSKNPHLINFEVIHQDHQFNDENEVKKRLVSFSECWSQQKLDKILSRKSNSYLSYG